MYKFFLAIMVIFFFSCTKQETEEFIPMAEKGVLDLRQWDFEKNGNVSLNGEWEFYWEQLLSSDDFNNLEKDIKKEFIQVPKSWKGKEINGKKIDQFGYATYRLKVLLNDNFPQQFSINTPYIPTACTILVNGDLVSSIGHVSTNKHNSKPGFINQIFAFNSEVDSLEIVIQVSNSSFYKAGLAYDIQLGSLRNINRSRIAKLSFELFLIGGILIMALFFISFYAFRPIDKSALYFGFYCLMISIYSFFVGSPHLMLLSDLPFWFQTNIIRITAYLFPLFLVLFFHEVFPNERKKFSIYLFVLPSVVLAILTIVLPIRISSPLIIFFRYLFVFTLFYIGYIIIRAMINKRESALVLLVGFLFLFIFTMNDILHHHEIIQTTNLVSLGVFVFIATQSYFLSIRFAKSFKKSERLALELAHINKNLENSIKQGTLEISQQKEEITTQAEQLKKTNEKLIELGHFKDNLTHMIVHDLKNPLNVIHSLPDILSPGDDIKLIRKAGSQMLSLITNILDVHKYEDSKMELNSENLFLTKIVTESINQTKSLSNDKRINIINKVDEALKVFGDNEILERVFINLITNAIKFTPKDGKITIDASYEKNDTVKISVEDTGVGISPKMLENIFDKFVQAIAKKSGEARSTGLGLTFCKLAVEAHGGKIWAESPKNGGAVFYFTLPVA